MIEYVHIPEDEEIQAAGGSYRIKEEILNYKGKDVLYLISEAQGPISFCCGSGCLSAGSIFIKGRVVEWKTSNDKAEFVSKLEAIEDKGEQEEIREVIKAKHKTSAIHF
jgi:hypothetical protein